MKKPKSEIAEIPTLRGGLRGRITGVVLLAALGTALAVGSAGVYAVYAPLQERIEQTYSRVLARSAEEVVELLDAARIEIGSIAGQPRLRKAILGAAARSEQAGPVALRLSSRLSLERRGSWASWRLTVAARRSRSRGRDAHLRAYSSGFGAGNYSIRSCLIGCRKSSSRSS